MLGRDLTCTVGQKYHGIQYMPLVYDSAFHLLFRILQIFKIFGGFMYPILTPCNDVFI
jgi:hypothetical protein